MSGSGYYLHLCIAVSIEFEYNITFCTQKPKWRKPPFISPKTPLFFSSNNFFFCEVKPLTHNNVWKPIILRKFGWILTNINKDFTRISHSASAAASSDTNSIYLHCGNCLISYARRSQHIHKNYWIMHLLFQYRSRFYSSCLFKYQMKSQMIILLKFLCL